MEQGDILIAQLRQSGLNIDASTTPADITTDVLYDVLLTGLEKLGALTAADRKKRFPKALPAATASKFSVAQSLVQVLHGAGCSGFGYDNLVYPVEAASKLALEWLVTELGRAAEAAAQRHRERDDDAAPLTDLQRRIVALQRIVTDAVGSAAASGKKARGTQLIQPSRRVARPVGASGAFWAVPAASALGEEAEGTEENIMSQVSVGWKVVSKSHTFIGDVVKPIASQVALDTISEAHSTLIASSKPFLKAVVAVVNERQVASPTSPVIPNWVARLEGSLTKPEKKSSKTKKSCGPSAIEFFSSSEAGLLDASTITSTKKKQQEEEAAIQEGESSHQANRAKRQEEELSVKDQLHHAKQELRKKKAVLQELNNNLEAAQSLISDLKGQLSEEEAAALARWEAAQAQQDLLSLMDDPEGSEATIQLRITELKEQRRQVRDAANAKLQKVEKKREQLLEENDDEGEGREEQLADIRQKIKEAKLKAKQRGREVKMLQADYERCPKDIDRSGFLRLIFDMTANIRKQHQQLEGVKRDMAESNAAITALEERTAAIFKGIEERVYSSASTAAPTTTTAPAAKGAEPADDFSRQAYRNLVELQDSYTSLINAIRARGVAAQELHELDEKVGKLKRVVGTYNTEQMQQDLEAVEADNLRLEEEISAYQQQ
ncbi:Hypothetical protein, putative [Bodo saltans]|uniref:Uncharacterized protein n=1 Tax=Bodo saltans TaxID=75058 RepID=A0A0S4IQU6_BODSA|nr:Hypothetical protein, putative [Bodo saltans]|eukprot:CUE95752.1 Hypothetical protein, putative [Bodo saltans]